MINIEPKDQFLVSVRDIIKKLDKQGTVSKNFVNVDEGNLCAYRGANGGEACAVGHIIKDEFYNTDLEGRSLTDPVFTEYFYDDGDVKDPILLAVEKSVGFELTLQMYEALATLQVQHDNVWEPSEKTFSELLRGKMEYIENNYIEEALRYI